MATAPQAPDIPGTGSAANAAGTAAGAAAAGNAAQTPAVPPAPEGSKYVGEDEHVTQIAMANGYGVAETLWKKNPELSGKRKNKNILFYGYESFRAQTDVIKLEPIDPHKGSATTETVYKKEVPVDKLFMRLRLLNEDFTPMKAAHWKLTIQGGHKPIEGETDDKGQFEPEIPPSSQHATLEIWPEGAKKPGPGPETESETYTIKKDDWLSKIAPNYGMTWQQLYNYKDNKTRLRSGDPDLIFPGEQILVPKKKEAAGEAAETNAEEDDPTLRYNLTIGALNPIEDKNEPDDGLSGIQQRLNNLGFFSGRVDGELGTTTKAAIKAFRDIFLGPPAEGAEQSDQVDEWLKGKLAELHDAPDNKPDPKVELEASKVGKRSEAKSPQATGATGVEPRWKEQPNLEGDAEQWTGVDIGCVAPDHEDRVNFNALRYAPVYHVELCYVTQPELWKFFPTKASKIKKGRMAGMQALEFFPLPLDHTHSTNNRAYNACWPYFGKKAPPAMANPSDNQTTAKLQSLMHTGILDGGKLPEKGKPEIKDESGTVTQAKKEAEVKRIYIPGTYAPFHDNATPAAKRFVFGTHDKFKDVEKKYYKANPWLGKIPIRARVQKRTQLGGWVPAERVNLFFQLIKPEKTPVENPKLRNPQQTYVDKVKNDAKYKAADATDPQAQNCHESIGGRRKAHHPVDDNVFYTKDNAAKLGEGAGAKSKAGQWEGFFVKRPGDAELGHADFNAAKKADVGKVPQAAQVYTNEEGEAGMVFCPSHCAGDSYAIRCFVGPGTLASDGKEINAPHVADTGTFEIWRKIRICQMLVQPAGPVPADATGGAGDTIWQTELGTWLANGYQGNADVTNQATYFREETHLTPKVTPPMLRQSPPGTPNPLPAPAGAVTMGNIYTSRGWMASQFARAFCKLEVDDTSQRQITAAEWQRAFTRAQTGTVNEADGTANADPNPIPGATSAAVNMNQIVYHDVTMPHWIGMRHPVSYNNNRGAGFGAIPLPLNNAWSNRLWAVISHMQISMLGYFSEDGLLPGLTLIRGGYGDAYGANGFGPGFGSSGIGGRPTRGCYIFWGQPGYGTHSRVNSGSGQAFAFCYQNAHRSLDDPANPPVPARAVNGASSSDRLIANTLHEVGHTLFHRHQLRGGAGDGGAPPANSTHDPIATDHCIMSYHNDSFGDFCGKCLLRLRGWDVRSITD